MDKEDALNNVPSDGISDPSSGNSKEKLGKSWMPWKSKQKDPEEKEDKPPRISFRALFKYATTQEKIYMTIACISAAIHGALLPLFTIVFGDLIDGTGEGETDFVSRIGSTAKWFLVLAAVAFVTSLIQVRFQIVVAQRVCARLRRKFFRSIMSQEFTWYDGNDGGELTSRVASDVNIIQSGIGDKVTTAVQFIFMFFVGIIIAFIYGPLLTLVILSLSPLLIGGGAVFGKMAADSTGDGLGAYGSAGAIASEVLGLIRVVTAYNGQNSEADRYRVEVERAYRSNVRKGVIGGIFLGFTMFVIFCSYAIAFYYGAKRSLEGGDILTSFFAVIIACVSIGQAAPSFQAFSAAQGAAPRIFDIIERQSRIDPLNEEEGEVISNFKGHISFSNVDFKYKRFVKDDDGDVQEDRPYVLQNFSVEAPPGTSHALVGPSGCGKSTTVRLIERFYDIDHGSLTLDGVDVRSLNVRWLRSQIGYVGQMPTLFMLSIRDNIALGAPMELVSDEKSGKKVWQRKLLSDDEIIDAAKMANAHGFIMKLPEKYDTLLGERGALLSGGQKQRICIARALVRNPKILILDESTAALDAQSERIVQLALEKATTGRTTITIAHRLSTVRNAHVISVLDKGRVVESGTHTALMELENGAYRQLVEHQHIEARKAESTQNSKLEAGGALGEAHVLKDSVTKTKASETKDKEDEEDTLPPVDSGVFWRVLRYNAKEFPFMLIGMIGAAMAGASFPISAILFSEAIVELISTAEREISTYSLAYLGVGAGAFVGNFLHQALMTLSGERLTKKLRMASFETILRQEIAFFDETENALGSLTTRLATEATAVQGLSGGTLGGIGFGLGAILTGFLVAYISCWKVAAVVTAIFPLMAFAGALQMKMMAGFDADADKKYQSAGAVASEAVDNFESVTAIGVQDIFTEKYNKELMIPLQKGRKSALVAGFAFGVSEFMSFALWAVSFWVGGLFVEDGSCDLADFFKAITGLLFAGMMLGQMSSIMPDLSKSQVAATKIFRLLDRKTKIDPADESGAQSAIEGEVDLKDLEFVYPTRPDVPVLRKLSVSVGKGKTLALVGASGCGKSTVVALLERFYDPYNGNISIDGVELKELNVKWARRHMSLVSQEPDLFNRSIRDNIAYGLGHEEGTVVTDDKIIEAAKSANAHHFISELTEGYDTVVGPRGNKLSGGQRQRVAIARAIVRHPKLLLLDEATSALDAVSERLVQDALDLASADRTTVAIAHRLSTVKDADAIAVVARGKIVELGTHEQLLRVNGEYATLVKNQLSGDDE